MGSYCMHLSVSFYVHLTFVFEIYPDWLMWFYFIHFNCCLLFHYMNKPLGTTQWEMMLQWASWNKDLHMRFLSGMDNLKEVAGLWDAHLQHYQVSQSDCVNLHSHQQWVTDSIFLVISLIFEVIRFTDFCLSDGYKIGCQCFHFNY